MKVLTFDIEEWFHILDHPGSQSVESWDKFPSRLKAGVETILEMLSVSNQKATFFCLGWVAEKHPDVIRTIDNAGYHIATHSYAHQLAYTQSPNEFREDLRRSIGTLQEITGKAIDCYRAPGFSITSENLWAFEVLIAEGIKIDCSLFPASRAHGGLPNIKSAFPSVGKWGVDQLKLLPINTKQILGRKIVYSGGGYFRLFPHLLIHRWFGDEPYVMTYFHPRDFDFGQPVISGLSAFRRFKSYVGIQGARQKLARLLSAYKFVDVKDADSNIEWASAPNIDLRTGTSLELFPNIVRRQP